MINGATRPVLAFHSVLFDIPDKMEVNFLVLNASTGLWVASLYLLAAFCDVNRLMNHATRLTDEVFELLIAFIFIVVALGSPFSEIGVYWYLLRDTHRTRILKMSKTTHMWPAHASVSWCASERRGSPSSCAV